MKKIEKVSTRHITVYTDIIINAPLKKVWDVLTDFEKIPEWCSTFQGIKGNFKNGSSVEVIYKEKDKIRTYKKSIVVVENEMFGWSAPIVMGINDHHKFIVKDMGDGTTKFIQSDESKGGITWIIGKMITKTMLDLYLSFNNELKERVESLI